MAVVDTYTGSAHAALDPSAIPRPSTAGGVAVKKRTSLLVAATDALGIKFRRKRPSTPARLPPNATILPDIIEIAAQPPDAESEERERLREEAAQLLGISVDPDTQSVSQTTEEDEPSTEMFPSHVSDFAARSSYTRTDMTNRSSNSLPSPTRPTLFASRRSGSIMTHNRRTSNPAPPIPPFPANVDALQEFKQFSACFPKYYAPSSLRIFAVTKNWKLRYIMLTAPLTVVAGGSEPAVSYLHLFKSAAAGETEIERLEINEDSVVFIAEDDVAGRKYVVKVGGRVAGGPKKNQVIEEGGKVMWLLQIYESEISQRWISTIKSLILGQRYAFTIWHLPKLDFVTRTIRAGLAIPTSAGSYAEPRGDMDVMLSIRQQGIVAAPAPARQSTSSPQPVAPEGNYASSISSQSLKSQATGPRTPTSSTSASGFRSLFSSRPRATSRATSLDSERESDSYPSMNHMLSKMRPGTADSKRSTDRSFMPPLSVFASNFYPLQRKIVREHGTDSSLHKTDGEGTAPAAHHKMARGSALGALSLQPPPRKRRTSGMVVPPTSPTTSCPPSETAVDQVPRFSDEPPPSSPRLSRFGSPQQRPRVPSVQSVSTIASTDNATSQDRSSVSTSRSARRWSRQSVLPSRSILPGGPQTSPLTAHLQPNFAAEQHIHRTISNQSTDMNSLPSFAPFNTRRASTASGYSVKSAGTSQSLFPLSPGRTSRPSSAHRASMPPPTKPAPTSALPPAPGQSSSSSPTMASFRESVAVRPGRLSTVIPQPISTSSDEKLAKSHRRASSGSYFSPPAYSNSSMSSLVVPSHSDIPAPRPIRPLPPTPTTPQFPHLLTQSPQPAQRESFLKRGLRILGAPPTISVSDDSLSGNIPGSTFHPFSNTITSVIDQTTEPATATLIPQPGTPIAEKIIPSQNDSSFFQFDTPTIPCSPPPRPLPPTPDQLPEITSLLPPPRRSSKHISPAEIPDSEAPPIPNPPLQKTNID